MSDELSSNRGRVLERLGRMVAKGQVSAVEADRLRAARTDEEHDAAVVAIRSRHAEARLNAAVESGAMSRTEADENLARIQQGEHPRGLRAHLRSLRRH